MPAIIAATVINTTALTADAAYNDAARALKAARFTERRAMLASNTAHSAWLAADAARIDTAHSAWLAADAARIDAARKVESAWLFAGAVYASFRANK